MSVEALVKPTADDVTQIISDIDPSLLDPDSPMNIVARIYVASWFKGVGSQVDKIAKFLDISEDDVDPVAKRFRESGIWCDDHVEMSCVEDDGEIDLTEFLLAVLVGNGMVECMPVEDRRLLDVIPELTPGNRMLLAAFHFERSLGESMWTTVQLRTLLESMHCSVNNPAATMHYLTTRNLVHKVSEDNRPGRQKFRCLTDAGATKAEQIVSDQSTTTSSFT